MVDCESLCICTVISFRVLLLCLFVFALGISRGCDNGAEIHPRPAKRPQRCGEEIGLEVHQGEWPISQTWKTVKVRRHNEPNRICSFILAISDVVKCSASSWGRLHALTLFLPRIPRLELLLSAWTMFDDSTCGGPCSFCR